MEPIITIKNLSKKYNIVHQRGGYISLRDVIANILKNPFKFAKSKAKQIAGLETKEEFWALKNINLEIKKGEVIGVIGSNGAGKSTLLKILSQITPPTTGEIIINGRVGSLLEVGTGFHPELSGRENIMLNGAILGMRRQEIIKKFDEIVKFAGVEKFLDTPVKYYSSGMYVRLAFSVAAHMEPDILIVDEVLAVGDAEFQKKCLGKMDDITKKEGRTIIFVSHNMNAIERLCKKCVLLKNGEIIKEGDTKEVINYYTNKETNLNSVIIFPKKNNENGRFKKLSILDKNNKPSAQIPISQNFFIEIEYEIFKPINKKLIFIYFYYQEDLLLVSSEGDTSGQYKNYEVGKYKTIVKIPSYQFQPGLLHFDVILRNLADGKGCIDLIKNVNFEIINDENPRYSIFQDANWGRISTILNYQTKKIA